MSLEKICENCKHFNPIDSNWNRNVGTCKWPMPPWIGMALHKADMRAHIVGKSAGENCPVWEAKSE